MSSDTILVATIEVKPWLKDAYMDLRYSVIDLPADIAQKVVDCVSDILFKMTVGIKQ